MVSELRSHPSAEGSFLVSARCCANAGQAVPGSYACDWSDTKPVASAEPAFMMHGLAFSGSYKGRCFLACLEVRNKEVPSHENLPKLIAGKELLLLRMHVLKTNSYQRRHWCYN